MRLKKQRFSELCSTNLCFFRFTLPYFWEGLAEGSVFFTGYGVNNPAKPSSDLFRKKSWFFDKNPGVNKSEPALAGPSYPVYGPVAVAVGVSVCVHVCVSEAVAVGV